MQILLRIILAFFTPTNGAEVEKLRSDVSEVLHHLHRVYEAWSLHAAARELPDVERTQVDQFVDAALELQTPYVPATLLVALAWGESRFDAAAQPACGVMQVYPNDLGEPTTACAEWRRDLKAGVRAGVREIEIMLADKRVGGNMWRALLYRACGNKAFNGSCDVKKYTWVNIAMARWHDLAAKTRHALIPGS